MTLGRCPLSISSALAEPLPEVYHSGSMKPARLGHCKMSSSADWSNRWTDLVFIMNARRDSILTRRVPVDQIDPGLKVIFSQKLSTCAESGQNCWSAAGTIQMPFKTDRFDLQTPQKALCGGIPGAVLEPLVRSWSHFVGIYRQKLTRSIEN